MHCNLAEHWSPFDVLLFRYFSKGTLKTSVELLKMFISATKCVFSIKLIGLFPFLDAHYRVLEGKAITIAWIYILAY